MTLHDLCQKTKISMSTLRKLHRLKVDFSLIPEENAENTEAAAIRFHLARNPDLTVNQMLRLIAEPDLIFELKRYTERAQAQIDALGNYKATAAPRAVTAYIADAGKGEKGVGDPAAVQVLVDWLKAILPTKPVNFGWIAVRLLINLPESLRAENAKMLLLTMINVRNHEDFKPYWSRTKGKIIYARPNKMLDL